MTRLMKRLALAAFASTIAFAAQAACYADYKAKRDNPLQLQYGVIELADAACSSRDTAFAQISARISVDGWVLLNIVSTFDASGLAQRKESAGNYYLRY